MMTPFALDTQGDGQLVSIALSGELDLASAERVEEELRRVESQHPALVVLDLSGLEFVDSTGLGVIIHADERARAEGRRLAVVQGPETVQRVFRITKVDERLEIVADASALKASG